MNEDVIEVTALRAITSSHAAADTIRSTVAITGDATCISTSEVAWVVAENALSADMWNAIQDTPWAATRDTVLEATYAVTEKVVMR
jgi:hypothetical protein